jgi:o-succinylbenzoate synthase
MSTALLAIRPYGLQLRRPWISAAGSVAVREGCLVRLEVGGRAGYGELAPLPGHGGETLAEARAALPWLLAELTRLPGSACGLPGSPRELRRAATTLAQLAPDAPAARAALDLAVADLAARRAEVPLARWLDPAARAQLAVNAVVGAVNPEEATREARAAVAHGFGTLKVKVGTGAAQDLARLAAVRASVGPALRLRVDANGAWDAPQAATMLRALASFDLEYAEQPVAAAEVEALARLRVASPVALAADEALCRLGGLERVLALGAADVLVLKPGLIGGISTAWSWAQRAATGGLDVVVTTALESAVGRAGAAHLGAALPDRGRAHGLATGAALVEDVAAGLAVIAGQLELSPSPGLGIVPDGDGGWETIARVSLG